MEVKFIVPKSDMHYCDYLGMVDWTVLNVRPIALLDNFATADVSITPLIYRSNFDEVSFNVYECARNVAHKETYAFVLRVCDMHKPVEFRRLPISNFDFKGKTCLMEVCARDFDACTVYGDLTEFEQKSVASFLESWECERKHRYKGDFGETLVNVRQVIAENLRRNRQREISTAKRRINKRLREMMVAVYRRTNMSADEAYETVMNELQGIQEKVFGRAGDVKLDFDALFDERKNDCDVVEKLKGVNLNEHANTEN